MIVWNFGSFNGQFLWSLDSYLDWFWSESELKEFSCFRYFTNLISNRNFFNKFMRESSSDRRSVWLNDWCVWATNNWSEVLDKGQANRKSATWRLALLEQSSWLVSRAKSCARAVRSRAIDRAFFDIETTQIDIKHRLLQFSMECFGRLCPIWSGSLRRVCFW